MGRALGRRYGYWLLLFLLLASCGPRRQLQVAPTLAASAVAQVPSPSGPTALSTVRPTDTPAPGSTASPSAQPSDTPTTTPSATPPATPTATITATAVPPTATATPTGTPTGTPTVPPTATSTASPAAPSVIAGAYPPLDLTPGAPRSYLQQFTMVSYYGSAEGAGMGILNFRDPPQLLADLRGRAADYQALLPQKQVLPTFHVIVTIADPYFGEDRNFNHRASLSSIESWLDLAQREGIAVVLDVQPGHAPLQEEFDRIRPYLSHPHVHLALDSEYAMERTPGGYYEVPGQVLGSLYAAQINPIQAQLQEIAMQTGANKVLILHQFENEMLPDKENIVDYPNVELVVDSDGWGGVDKVRDYQQYAGEPAFEFGGIKLYRNWDNPLLAPADVLDIEPQPAVVIYQ